MIKRGFLNNGSAFRHACVYSLYIFSDRENITPTKILLPDLATWYLMIVTITTGLTIALPQLLGPRSPRVLMFHGLLNIYAVHPSHAFSFHHLYTICIPTTFFTPLRFLSLPSIPLQNRSFIGCCHQHQSCTKWHNPSPFPSTHIGHWLLTDPTSVAQNETWANSDSNMNTKNKSSNICVPQIATLFCALSITFSKMFQVMSISNQDAFACYQKQNRVSPCDWATLNGS